MADPAAAGWRRPLRRLLVICATVLTISAAGPLAGPSATEPSSGQGRAPTSLAAARTMPPRPTLWAVVRGDGSVARSSGLAGVLRLNQGAYEVRFTQDVRNCAYTATVGDPGLGLVFTPGLVFTAGGHISAEGVYVETKNLGGGLTDFPFHLKVSCPGSDRAVVRSDGHLVRGSAGSVIRFGPGRYEAVFSRDVSRCAYTATIGDTANRLVFAPGLVFTAGGHLGANGVYVETKNLGGGLSDFPFHLAVDCQEQPPTDRWYAVVDRNGFLVRSNQPTSVTRYGPGRFDVRTIRNLVDCVYTVAVGDPANQLVFNPGLAFTASGRADFHSVYVETKNLGGGLSDFPFQLSIDCSKRPIPAETISILNLNIQGRDTEFGPWRSRHARLASWMGAEQVVPDLIVLQEMPAKKCFFLGGCDPYDYEAAFELMVRIENAVGVPYRVALFSAPPTGEPRLDQGRLVLYNPARIRNATPIRGAVGPWDSLTRDIRPHYSHPCADTPERLRRMCARVDGTAPTAFAAPHWAAGKPEAGIAFGRFSLAEVPPDSSNPPVLDVYDEHAPFIPNSDGTPDLMIAVDAVARLEQVLPASSGARLLPPLLIGDFNIDSKAMALEMDPGARMERFEIVAYSPPYVDTDETTPDGDVIGVIAGKPSLFPSRFRPDVRSNRILPELTPFACGSYPVRWSDHCGQYVELGLAPR
jgi:hypothetical protein